ncbi:MAG TPA: sulfite exporter TauE/SafE family protein [Candidatus Sulfotelmatobacter sp.]|nr:sulfite exporter TauE/SafE family protein [Candidatus Sulfotelmatobacter sp.]
MVIYLVVLLLGLVAGAVSGIIGTGASIMLLPVLVFQFGPKQAVPIMAIAALMANVGKMLAWWREVDWRAFAAYSVTGVPAAALGARTLLVLPSAAVDVALGLFFLAMIPARRRLEALELRLALWQLALAGAVIGFITGIVISTGPLSVPAFTSYGLTKGAFLSTEAASSLALMIAKVATFRELGALPVPAILKGLLIGASVMAGAFVGKAVVQRMSPRLFHRVLDGLLLVSGLALLWAALG